MPIPQDLRQVAGHGNNLLNAKQLLDILPQTAPQQSCSQLAYSPDTESAVAAMPCLEPVPHEVKLPWQVATGSLDFYTNWTGVHQPLTKFDYVAVPGKAGAMENWGLLQFDERRMLVDPVRAMSCLGLRLWA